MKQFVHDRCSGRLHVTSQVVFSQTSSGACFWTSCYGSQSYRCSVYQGVAPRRFDQSSFCDGREHRSHTFASFPALNRIFAPENNDFLSFGNCETFGLGFVNIHHIYRCLLFFKLSRGFRAWFSECANIGYQKIANILLRVISLINFLLN